MPRTETPYNGWKNYETWNVALWLGNDEELYRIARRAASGTRTPYRDTVEALARHGITATPDGVAYDDADLSLSELNQALREL